MSPPLTIQGLTFGYTARPLLFGDFHVSFTADFNLIRGPSGCGKTTLLKLCGGFMTPFNGFSMSWQPSHPLLVLQEDGLWPWLSGLDNIRRVLRVPEKTIEASPLYPLVASLMRQRAFELSVGQRRLIELVRALLAPADLLMLDEPFSALDRAKRAILIDHLLARSRTTRIIMTSHYLEHVAADAVRVFEFLGDPPYETLAESAGRGL